MGSNDSILCCLIDSLTFLLKDHGSKDNGAKLSVKFVNEYLNEKVCFVPKCKCCL